MMTLVATLLIGMSAPALAAEGGTAGSGKIKAPELQPDIPPYSLESRDFIFPSGLRVIMQPDHSAPVVAITTYFDRGSTSDPEGKEGIAHFVEHLWFKSRHVVDSDVRTWDILSENGCDLNASTWMDWTNYMTVCPNNALRPLMRFASLRMTDPVKSVTAAEVDSEREVIRNELRMRMENGGGEMLRYIFDRVYGPDHPYHRLTIGTHGSLDNITLEDIQQFTKDNYRPENATIVVVGDFDPEVASSLIFENFAPSLLHPDLTEDHLRMVPRPEVDIEDIDPNNPDPDKVFWLAVDPNNPSNRLRLLETPQKRNESFGRPTSAEAYNTEVGVFDAPVDGRKVVIGWSAPGGYKGNDFTMNIAANMVANAMRQGVFDDNRFSTFPNTNLPNVTCGALSDKENTTVLCEAAVKSGPDGEQLAERLLDQLSSLWNPEIMANPQIRARIENEFAMARMENMQGMLASIDRVSGLGARATVIANHAHFTGSHRFHSDAMSEISELDFTAAMEFAKEWLTRNRAAAVVLNPLSEDDLVLDNSESNYHGAQSTEDRVVSTLDPEDITEELIREEVRVPDFDKMIDRTLDNGMRVVVMPHGEAPWMTVRAVAHGGTGSDIMDMDTVADWFSTDPRWERLPNGRPVLDPLRIAGSENDAQYDTWSQIGIDAPSGNVTQTLWMVRERLDNIRPDMERRGERIRAALRRHRRRITSRRHWVSRARNEAMGSGHPAFDLRTYEDYKKWKKVKRSEIAAYLDRKWAARNVTLVIVGNVNPDEAFDAAQTYFSSYRRSGGAAIPEPRPAPITSFEPKILLFDNPRSTQTDVTLACRLADGSPMSDATRQVATQMISDHLFDELRAREGITYGARAIQRARVGGTGMLFMSGLIQNSGVALAVQTFQKVADDAAAGEFPMNRFGATRLSRARNYGLRQQAITDLASWLSVVPARDLEWDYRWGYADRLAEVDVESMTALVEPCPTSQVITLEGPVEVIGKILDEAGIAYEEFDYQERILEIYDEHSKKSARKYRKYLEEKAEKEAKKAAEEADESEDSDE